MAGQLQPEVDSDSQMNREVANESSRAKIAWMILIAIASATLGILVLWRAPGLDLYARDLLMRTRGSVEPPADIVIVAIDDESIARLGRFPWPRQVIAKVLGIVSAAHPKAIALNILFSDSTNASEDKFLADSIARAGNVITAAQLVASSAGNAEWLRPLPEIEQASAAVGHVNVSTELEGTARKVILEESDNRGKAFWAMPIEIVRVGDGSGETSIREAGSRLHVGSHSIPIHRRAETFEKLPDNKGQVRHLSAQRMMIDYIGPGGSFSPYIFSVADLLSGRIRQAQLEGKYVLIGATAASLGDRLASPFIHMQGIDNRQHGSLMPGVEVLANALNTILRNRYYSDLPDWLSALCAGLIAILASAALSVGHERYETVKQVGLLAVLNGLLFASSYLLFKSFFIVPPLVPALVALWIAMPLTLIRRSMVANVVLDARLRELAQAEEWLWPSTARRTLNTAELISRLLGASDVVILERSPAAGHKYSLLSTFGSPLLASLLNTDRFAMHTGIGEAPVPASHYFDRPRRAENTTDCVARQFQLNERAQGSPAGVLVIAYRPESTPRDELVRLSIELANASLSTLEMDTPLDGMRASSHRGLLRYLPRRTEWRAQALSALQRRMLTRARFVDRAIQSAADGLLVSGPDGVIIFANRMAAEILGVPERSLIGSDLLARLGETPAAEREILSKLIIDRTPVEHEIAIENGPGRHFVLRLSPVQDGNDEARSALGWIALLSDITEQRKLQQMKTDVMALVTHELRTPLTAIQGISEVLSQFEVDAGRRREMHTAINEEAKRLSRMIDEYMDLTRLEAGVQRLRLAPLRLESLVERTLLLLDPVAARRGIAIARKFPPELAPLLADRDLLSRAVTNLVANAIKYSQPNSEVTVTIRETQDTEEVEVADHGPGIPPEQVGRIFEKFYRVPRIEDVETPGTGLGLTMVREIIELHCGNVTVESLLGTGSVFRLSLPKTPHNGGRKVSHGHR